MSTVDVSGVLPNERKDLPRDLASERVYRVGQIRGKVPCRRDLRVLGSNLTVARSHQSACRRLPILGLA